jgi:hypothetical protein
MCRACSKHGREEDCRILVGKSEGNRPIGRFKCKKMILKCILNIIWWYN